MTIRRTNKRKNTLFVSPFAIGALVFAIAICFAIGKHFIRDEHQVTVAKTEQRCETRDDCKYLVFTDKGVFENTDSLLEFKWNSSDVYGELVEGRQYTIKVYGVRFAFFSWYPNVVSVTPAQG